MDPEEIKVGEKYKLELLCILNKEHVIVFETPTGDHIPLINSDIECVSHANGIKNADPAQVGTSRHKSAQVAPKYDPCRLFKKGDKVEYRPKDGRANPNLLVGRRYKVAADEPCDSGIVQVEFDGLRHLDTFVAYNNLKLVTPVEELEAYFVQENQNVVEVLSIEDKEVPATVFFKSKHKNARERAEAERDRLNAEYRAQNAEYRAQNAESGRCINKTTKTQTTNNE